MSVASADTLGTITTVTSPPPLLLLLPSRS